jgi:RNA polymerase sigma factor (sigma-70 family)
MGESSTGGRFPTTRWSAIAGAREGDEAERSRSWDAIVRAYWKPIYKHLRLKWHRSSEDAQDLTQAFFERAMEKEFFATYDPERARFRTFLRTCLDRFASNERKAEKRLKRGGAMRALDWTGAEDELALADPCASPDEIFDREWRRHLFTLGIEALRERCESLEKTRAFEIFERYDLASESERPTYDVIARELGISTTSVTNQLAWARRELRSAVIEQLERITSNDRELRKESDALLGPSR